MSKPRYTNSRSARFAPQTNRSTTATRTRVAPDELDINLMFRDVRTVTNGVSPVAAKSFYTNAAYDVDPSIGSTETYGFDEYAAIYSYYRVVSYTYQITITNPNDYAMNVYILNTNTDPNVSGSRFDLYSTNPYCKSRLLGFKAPDSCTFRGRHRISQITGTPTSETADSFRALTTGIPTDLTWFTVAAECLSPATSISFSYDLRLHMSVRFYSREVDLSLSAFAIRVNHHLAARAKRRLEKALNPYRPANDCKFDPPVKSA